MLGTTRTLNFPWTTPGLHGKKHPARMILKGLFCPSLLSSNHIRSLKNVPTQLTTKFQLKAATNFCESVKSMAGQLGSIAKKTNSFTQSCEKLNMLTALNLFGSSQKRALLTFKTSHQKNQKSSFPKGFESEIKRLGVINLKNQRRSAILKRMGVL